MEIHDSACRLGLKSSPTQERMTISQEFASELQKFETRNKKEKTLSIGRNWVVGGRRRGQFKNCINKKQ